MANLEHVEHCKQGVDAWNDWRKRNPEVQPDLSGASLCRTYLSDVNLSGVNLNYVDFNHANLSGANLSGASLVGANLSGANLSGVNLSGVNLSGASFYTTRLGSTIFARVDLCTVKGLDTVRHYGPSSVDINTVKLPEGKTRIHFLRGAGFSDAFIDYLPSLLHESCFISYTHQDETLATRLYNDLQNRGVRCWLAPEDMKVRDNLHRVRMNQPIDHAIYMQKKLLLLLSEHSLASSWIELEVETALDREPQEGDVLFPVRLDDAVMHTFQVWAATLRRTQHIGDFTKWQDDAMYQQRFEELLHHLKGKTI